MEHYITIFFVVNLIIFIINIAAVIDRGPKPQDVIWKMYLDEVCSDEFEDYKFEIGRCYGERRLVDPVRSFKIFNEGFDAVKVCVYKTPDCTSDSLCDTAKVGKCSGFFGGSIVAMAGKFIHTTKHERNPYLKAFTDMERILALKFLVRFYYYI